MVYDAVIVGGGIAGLTAAAYLAKAGKSVMICEKEEKCGGLVNTFERDGYIYDGGIRAFENSGVLFPMLRQLGISIDFVPNNISIGIEDQVIRITSEESVEQYTALLKHFYPESHDEIDQIVEQIRLMMRYMEVQYGIDNPMFLDLKKDREYMMKAIMPWMFKYAMTAPKIAKLNLPVVEFLRKFTQNQSLLDIISQHFFRETPAFFALSYLKLYLDYHYPLGGTSRFVEKLLEIIQTHGGVISTSTQVVDIDIEQKFVRDRQDRKHSYRRLIWAADQQSLYRLLGSANIPANKSREDIAKRRHLIKDKTGNDSVLTLFLGVKLDKKYFSNACSEHFFFTPSRIGQSACGPVPIGQDRKAIESWLEQYFRLTTYEISIPVLRDDRMAPVGKSGLIISVLFDYQLTRQVRDQGWYDEFKTLCEGYIINILNTTVYPGFDQSIEHRILSTPLTMEKLTGNHEGAITGWAFSNHPIPAESRIPKIMNAIKTPIPGVYQAGQWTYSPSGLPISLLTGKIAADRVIKDLK